MIEIENLLIVGGSGFLGLHLIETYYPYVSGKIFVFDIRPIPKDLPTEFTFDKQDVDHKKIEVVIGDIASQEDIDNAIINSNCEVVVHCASPIHGISNEKIYYDVNVNGTQNIINSCIMRSKVKCLIYTSSAGVIFNGNDIFNGNENWPIPEKPMDAYNDSKAKGEKLVVDAGKNMENNLLTVALRPAGIFGPGDRQLIPGLRNVLNNGQSKFQIGDNNNLFDWTYVSNIAMAHLLATSKLLNGLYLKKYDDIAKISGECFFITNDSPSYFWSLARTVWKADNHIDKRNIVLPRKIALLIGYISQFISHYFFHREPSGLTPFRVKIVCATRYHSIEKAKKILGYTPKIDLEEGIKRTLAWLDEEKTVNEKKQ